MSVELAPEAIEAGLAESETVGAGAAEGGTQPFRRHNTPQNRPFGNGRGFGGRPAKGGRRRPF